MPITTPADTLYKWCTETGNRVAPPTIRKAQGFGGYKPGSQVMNHILGVMSDWLYACSELLLSPIGRASEAATIVPLGLAWDGGGWYVETGLVLSQGAGGVTEVKIDNPTGGSLIAAISVLSIPCGGKFDAAGALRLHIPARSSDTSSCRVDMIGSVATALTVPAASVFENLALDSTVESIPLTSGTGLCRGPIGMRISFAIPAGEDITVSRLALTSAAE